MGEGLYLFSVSSTLLVKDKPLRGAYASLTSVVDTLLLKQAISPSLCIVDATNRNGPRVAAFTGRLVHIHRTGGRILPDRWCWQNVICTLFSFSLIILSEYGNCGTLQLLVHVI